MRCLPIAFALWLWPTVLTAQPVPAPSAKLAFTRVNVVDVIAGRMISDQTVLISGKQIETVGPSGWVRIPNTARVVDSQGKYLIPDLWDMHAQAGADELTRTIVFPLYVAHGVTGSTGSR